MTARVQRPRQTGASRQEARRTIGFFIPSAGAGPSVAREVWQGAVDGAEACGVNLVCFIGGTLAPTGGPPAPYNVVYNLADPDVLDGIVSWASSLCTYLDPEEKAAFHQRFDPLPLVSLGESMGDIPVVLVDSYQGMREVMEHLVETHGYRRLAMIRGPEAHPYAQERLRAYSDALEAYGIPFNPRLVTPPGDFSALAGVEGIRLLLDERKLRPQADFEAVVTVSDVPALGALGELQARGIRVPEEVALVGFNDTEDGRLASPPLTSVRIPFHEQARQSIEMLSALIEGQEIPQQIVLPARIVVRQSCGCPSRAVVQAAAGPVESSDEPLRDALATHREEILADMVQAVGGQTAGPVPEWASQLLVAFVAEMENPSAGQFLAALDHILRQVTAADGDVGAWQGALSALRRHCLPYLQTDEAYTHAEDLWQQARVLVSEATMRLRFYEQNQSEARAQRLQEIGASLITTFNIDELMEIAAQSLPALDIPSCFISLYEKPEAPTEWSRLILAYDEKGRAQLEAGGQRFPSTKLVPPGTLPRGRRFSFVVQPLYFRENQIGFALFEIGPRDAAIYETLRGQLSSALRGALLFRERERLLTDLETRALQLQTAAQVSRTVSSILHLDQLIQQVVDLISQRFDLYYAGLYLLDVAGEWTGEPARWAVLRAGSGEAGRQMVADRFRWEIGSPTLVGWCAASGQPHLSPDVRSDPLYQENPLLPEARSEMLLPLKVADQVIGVLDVQERQAGAFDQDDMTIFQSMADQLATAIENARAVAGMRRLSEDLQRTLETQEELLATIRELSTPVMPLVEGVILLPLVGHIDSARAEQIIEQLLAGVDRHHARIAILDITGVPVVDTAVANSLLRAAQAAQLLGAEVVLVGIRPEVAETIVSLGVELAGLVTASDLQSGIEYALQGREPASYP